MDHRHLFLQDLLSSPPESTQSELLLGGQQLQLTSPSHIRKAFPASSSQDAPFFQPFILSQRTPTFI